MLTSGACTNGVFFLHRASTPLNLFCITLLLTPSKVDLSIKYEGNGLESSRSKYTWEDSMLKAKGLSFGVVHSHHPPALLMRLTQQSKRWTKHNYIPCEEVFLFPRSHYLLYCVYASRLCLGNCLGWSMVPGIFPPVASCSFAFVQCLNFEAFLPWKGNFEEKML